VISSVTSLGEVSVATTFPVRGLSPEIIDKIDSAAAAAGLSRNAYIVQVLTEHARRVRPVASPEAFRRAADLASDLGDEELMRAAWS
jgi:hypothetical protein